MGRYPPHIQKDDKDLYLLPDKEFLNEINKYGGTPSAVFENEAIIKIFLPILRADYQMIANYQFTPQESKFVSDITILNGKNDPVVSPSDLVEWHKYTEGHCNICEFNGDHFFINKYATEIGSLINRTLQKSLSK